MAGARRLDGEHRDLRISHRLRSHWAIAGGFAAAWFTGRWVWVLLCDGTKLKGESLTCPHTAHVSVVLHVTIMRDVLGPSLTLVAALVRK